MRTASSADSPLRRSSTATASAIYLGWVRHRRHLPRPHSFRYPIFYLYLDLDELPALFDERWLWSARGLAPAQFRREDHFGDPRLDLKSAVRELVVGEGGARPAKVRLLTQLRYWGYCFNPICIFYCFDSEDNLTDLVLEVSNTPWGEKHCYVLRAEEDMTDNANTLRHRFDKEMHVSPFLPMDMTYECRATYPADNLYLHLRNLSGKEKALDADLVLERRELTGTALAKALLRFPFMTGRIVAAIHWQALKLYLKGIKFVPHPGSSGADGR